ncbi:hypothetical protein KAR91_22490 [Candidatus Pacearchaeota archaeon]|nr:hypothetical protein [Candidatus Pacearchaeota archaeon]
MSESVTMIIWSRISKDVYDRLVNNIKAVGTDKSKDVELIIKSKTTAELADFNAKHKSIIRRLKQDFTVNVISCKSDESRIKIYTIKPELKPIKDHPPKIIIGLCRTVNKLQIFEYELFRALYMGLMDKYRNK